MWAGQSGCGVVISTLTIPLCHKKALLRGLGGYMLG